MNNLHDRKHGMGLQDLFNWRSQTAATLPVVADEDMAAEVDEPPDHRFHNKQHAADFHRSTVRPQGDRKESLLTKALLKSPERETFNPEIHVSTDMSRRRSMISNTSLASTAELTSDGGLTSPSRTNTPSPPPPNTTYTNFTPYSLAAKAMPLSVSPMKKNAEMKETIVAPIAAPVAVSPKAPLVLDVIPKKRCITFACGGRRDPITKPTTPPQAEQSTATDEAPQRVRMIKFACSGPKPSGKATSPESSNQPKVSKPTESQKRTTSRSPSMTRKSPRPTYQSSRSHRDSASTIRRLSHSPISLRAKPKYIIADEDTLQSSEATRFHEFASEELQEDDWIRKGSDLPGARLTINDTLKMENAIRRLGNEAEEEAMEDEEDEEDEDEDEEEEEEEEEDEEEDEEDQIENEVVSINGSDDEASDGNETDNEAGFAESDDSDGEGFWTPGRSALGKQTGEPSTYRPSAHRAASASSIDSLTHMSPVLNISEAKTQRRRPRPIKIRPGTPDLPDSTDFVCGTLDEDRPLEDAYLSCMVARKNAKHRQIPQDIDPSFPTSDLDNEEDEHDDVEPANDSDDHVWLHGKFEDSDEEDRSGRPTTTTHRKSPGHSPRRLHSPPPKHRLRSPPPRKLFGGHSPRRMRSPPPARTIRSPTASPMSHATSAAINFEPLGSRPGLTHTKSLPRTPNAFCRQYRASRLIAANGNTVDGSDTADGHVRGAIDIVKGLEQKRQRRREKFYQKQCNRGRKGQPERRPNPGEGANRMRELGLLMAGKTGTQDPYILSA